MHNRRRVVADSNGSPRLTQTGSLQAAKMRSRDKSESTYSENNHQDHWHSPESQHRVDSVIDASQRNTRPRCTKHTIRHCYCKSPQIFRSLSQEDWNTHVRPVMSPQRRNFGEPYDTFRRPLDRFKGGSVFESRDKPNRFEVKTPPDLDDFYDSLRNSRCMRSWAPVDYGENDWGKTPRCAENLENGEGAQRGQGQDGGWNESAFHSGYEDMEVAPEMDEADDTDEVVIQWLQAQLIAERRRNAALEKRVRTLEEECTDPYC
ncbi:hypothetical protein CKM354_000846800 [Cercospora kikuchii]|uniref:Uncharacterized protein n=1 Tax=Cercospora kikuchii TaxID=84275 RepID=A0A9P3CT75_9PEZI|nr:uncharacterized protein CKM354_000846800 [Cercospora kikuchii]GIZ45295.1 hypothetical protein CKM354_000846800 [Cercospora kikuchii]